MNKKLILIIVSFIVTLSALAQSISPIETTEFCPNVNVTFTVTLPRISDNTTPTIISWTGNPIVVTGVSNLTNTTTQTTFTFVGKFQDYNQNQVFKVDYSTTSNNNSTYSFQFKRIKSLFYSTSCSPIQPNQTTITATRCQSQNFNISFTNIQWGTAFESPSICFGSITTYEYQLPVGWSIGSNVSTGSNWIAGGNNVTITSDLTHGIGGSIQVRAVNGCGTGLQPGQPTSISVLRPAPTLTITGGADVLCSGTSTYTVNGVPTGATVSWGISNTNIASIPIPSTGTSVTLTKTGNGVVVLTANVTDCIQTYPVTKSITLGAANISSTYTYNESQQPIHLWGADQYYNPLCSGVTSNIIADVQGQSSVTWSKVTSSPEAIPWTQTSNGVQFNFWNFGQTVIFEVDASNICGTTTQQYAFQSINCG